MSGLWLPSYFRDSRIKRMPAVISNKSQGVYSQPSPFHYPDIWERTQFQVDTGNLATQTYDVPSCNPGDILLAMVGADQSSGSVTFPAQSPDEDGWVTLFNENGGNTECRLVIAAKYATQADADQTVDASCSPSRETACDIICIRGAAPYDQWTFASANGANSAAPTFNGITVPQTEHWLALALQANDDNRGATIDDASYSFLFDTQVPGGSINGVSIHGWYKQDVLQKDATEQPGDITLSDGQGWCTTCILIPPNAQNDLNANSESVNILNPTFATDMSFWIGNMTRSAGGFDGDGFALGDNLSNALSYQDVPIPSQYHSAVDAERFRVEISYQAGAFQADQNRMVLYWIDDESPENILSSKANDYAASTTWTERVVKSVAAPGARALRIQIQANRIQSSQNDGYFDALVGTWYEDQP